MTWSTVNAPSTERAVVSKHGIAVIALPRARTMAMFRLISGGLRLPNEHLGPLGAARPNGARHRGHRSDGRALVKTLLWSSVQRDAGTRVLALVRDLDKAQSVFEAALAVGAPITFLVGDVVHLPRLPQPVDLVVHGAGITTSRDFVERPVDTMRTAVLGTEAVLDAAWQSCVRSVVDLSSMEAYGTPQAGRRLTEQDLDGLDPHAHPQLLPRASAWPRR